MSTTTETIFREYKAGPAHHSDRSAGDRSRHRQKVKDSIREHLPDIIAEESLIGKDGDKVIKIPIRGIKEFRFVYGDNKGTGTGDGNSQPGQKVGKGDGDGKGQGNGKAGGEGTSDIYEVDVTLDEILALLYEELKLPNLKKTSFKEIIQKARLKKDGYRKMGIPIRLDRFKTAKNRVKRMKAMGRHEGALTEDCKECAGFGQIVMSGSEDLVPENFEQLINSSESIQCQECGGTGKVDKRIRFRNEDRRFKHMTPDPKPQSNAAIIFVMDSSGSMDTQKKFLAKSFFFLLYNFIQAKYNNSEIVFISHDTEAREVNEDKFFHTGEGGGTFISSGLTKAVEVIKERYNPTVWNSYVAYIGDGDNFDSDNPKALSTMQELCEMCQLVGYGEIKPDGSRYYESSMLSVFEKVTETNFKTFQITSKDDVYPKLKELLSIGDEAAA